MTDHLSCLFFMAMVITGQANVVPEREYQEYKKSMGAGGRNRGSRGTKAQFSSRETKAAKGVQENGVEYSEASKFNGEIQVDVAPSGNGGVKFSKGSQVPTLLQKNAIPPFGKRTENSRGIYSSSLPPSSSLYNRKDPYSNQGNTVPLIPPSIINTPNYNNYYYDKVRNKPPLYTQSYNPYSAQKKILGQQQGGTMINQHGLYSPYSSNGPFISNGPYELYGPELAGQGLYSSSAEHELDEMQGLGPSDIVNSQIPWDRKDPKQSHFVNFAVQNNIITIEEAIKLGYKYDLITYHGVLYALLLPSPLTFLHSDLLKLYTKKKLMQKNKELLLELSSDILDEEYQVKSEEQGNKVIQANSNSQYGQQVQTDTLHQSNGGEYAKGVDVAIKTNNDIYGGDYSSKGQAHVVGKTSTDSHNSAESQAISFATLESYANAMHQQTEGETQSSSTPANTDGPLQGKAKLGSRLNRPKQYGMNKYGKDFRTKGVFHKRDRSVYETNKHVYGAAADWDNGAQSSGAPNIDAVVKSSEITESRFAQQQQKQQQQPQKQQQQNQPHTYRQPHMRGHRG